MNGRRWARSPAAEPFRVAVLVAIALMGAVMLLALLPSTAHAWTPGTHVFLGEAVLRSLEMLPGHVADLLRAYPYDFLYGSIAADTSIAKKYAPVGRHCHSWTVGLEIAQHASDQPLRAFALGYQSHLAADAVAHNYFVPRQLAITASTASLGHSYWESRFETHITDRCSRRARELILRDHARSDDHLDRILSPTIFSTPTNRRIFRGMVHAADSDSWQRIFSLMTENSRWDLTDSEVEQHLVRSFDFIIDWLRRGEDSDPFTLDPSGDEPLTSAKRVRRLAMRSGGTALAQEEAERRYGLPNSTLTYADALPTRLFDPARRGA